MRLRTIWLAAALPLGGCGLLPDAYTGCDEARPYQSARQVEPLRVPAGSDLPDTRNALRIPELATPELPREPGSCLEHPPVLGTVAAAGGAAAGEAAGSAVVATGDAGGLRAPQMEQAGPWQARLGARYQPTTDVDFDGGSTVEFNSSTAFLVGLSYALSEHFEIGANLSYDDRDYEALLAGDEDDEFFPVRGTVETTGVMFDLSYYFLTGRIRPFVSPGAGWSFVDTNVPTAPPQIGCWWNPWYGYICEGFQDTKNVDGFAYQAGAGVNVRLNSRISLTGSYQMSWVDYPKADGTPTFDAIQMILHWAF
jgi:opacity protein-like surface antigen